MPQQTVRHNTHEGSTIEQFPVKQQQRYCTDVVCMIIGLSFSFILIILTIFLFNNDHYNRTSFPSDSQGRVCGYDLKNHPFIYFTNLPDIVDNISYRKNRVCVQECPSKSDTRLKCVPTSNIGCNFNNNPAFTVNFYESSPQSTQIGNYCSPKDQTTNRLLYDDIDVTDRYNFFHQIKTITICGLIALGLSLLYLVSVQFFPLKMNLLSLILGMLTIFLMIVFTIFYPTGHVGARVAFSITLAIILTIVAVGAFKSKQCLDLHGIFLNYATKMVRQNSKVLIFIPIFLLIFAAFIFIIVLELKSFWSSAPVNFETSNPYYTLKPGSTTVWTTIVAIQLLWGLSFIKQAFNFCVSGNSVQWYKQGKQRDTEKQIWSLFRPFKYLVKFNLGSVISGSFMSAFFSILDYIFDTLRPDFDSNGPRMAFMESIDSFFDLVRSDTMAYINLSGNPYCNSSRYCEYLCKEAPASRNSQSNSRSYRICSHLFLAGLVSTINILLQGKETSLFIALVVFILSLFLSTFFISLHADAAEAIQIIFLLDYQFARLQAPNQKEIYQKILRSSLVDEVFEEKKKIEKRQEQRAQMLFKKRQMEAQNKK